MQIDKNKIYTQDSYEYVNFAHITDAECESILIWRNDDAIRKWMYNTSVIDLYSHKEFVASLKDREDRIYWLIRYCGEPIGVMNIIDIDYENNSAELGYYMRPDYMATGLGLDFVYNILMFTLLTLKIDKLYGSVNIHNKGAYMMDVFLGFKEIGRKILADNTEFMECYITPQLFLADKESKNDIKLFIKYIKSYGTK